MWEGEREGAVPLLQKVLRHLYALRRAGDGDDAVAGARQRLRDLNAGAALRANLSNAGPGFPDNRAGQLQTIQTYCYYIILIYLVIVRDSPGPKNTAPPPASEGHAVQGGGSAVLVGADWGTLMFAVWESMFTFFDNAVSVEF